MKQNILSPGDLLSTEGKLNEAGYATKLVKQYRRKAIKASQFRIKEWDYYLMYNQSFGIALTMADNSYMGLLSATLLDFNKKIETTVSPMKLLTLGGMHFPSDSAEGDLHFQNKKIEINFYHEEGGRRLFLNVRDFEDGLPLIVDVLLTNEPEESMVIATPFKEDEKAFYYNQKIIGMNAQGVIIYKGAEMKFDANDTFALLDWGRGVWTYDNTWYWSAATGIINGKNFGFNLGYGFGDTSQATENMLFYEGIAHKLEYVTFEIPKNQDGTDDYMKNWKFTSSDGRFEAIFEPIVDRKAFTSFKVILSDQHQVFGYFTGQAILDDGTCIKMERFLGFAEKVRNKW